MEIKFKKMTCKVCGNTMNLYFDNCRDINFSMTNNSFNWYKCINCKLISISTHSSFIESIEEYYKEYDPHNHGVKSLSKFSNSSINKVIKDLKKTKNYTSEFTLLDVGCGSGNLLFNIRKHFKNSKLFGLDYNIKSVSNNLKGINVKLYKGGLQDLNSDLKFDVIVSSQLLEHIDNPNEYVSFLNKHLKNNGVVYIDIPYVGSKSFRLFKKFWVHLDTPRHRNLFEIETLTLLFNEFEINQIETFGTGYAYISSVALLIKNKYGYSGFTIKPFMGFFIAKTIELFIKPDDKLFFKLAKK